MSNENSLSSVSRDVVNENQATESTLTALSRSLVEGNMVVNPSPCTENTLSEVSRAMVAKEPVQNKKPQKRVLEDPKNPVEKRANPELQLFNREFAAPTAPLDACEQKETEAKFEFSMMQFNLLADGLSGALTTQSAKTFLRVDRKYLCWEYRQDKIIEEIVRFSPDVLCVEELDHFDDLSFALKGHGYVGHFMVKAFSPCVKVGQKAGLDFQPDGVAVFFKEAMFTVVGTLEFRQEKEKYKLRELFVKSREQQDNLDGYRSAMGETENLLDKNEEGDFVDLRVLSDLLSPTERDRIISCVKQALNTETLVVKLAEFLAFTNSLTSPVGVAIRLQPRNGPDIVVVSTHLSSDKTLEGEHNRVEELQSLLKNTELSRLVTGANLFIGCDMNAAPKETKGYPPLAYKYVVKDLLEEQKGGEEDDVNTTHGLNLKSAYVDMDCGYSTWKLRAKKNVEIEDKHTIDYLFYPNDNKWKVNELLMMPSEEDINTERQRVKDLNTLELLPSPLPSGKYPSDHFSIMAKFSFA